MMNVSDNSSEVREKWGNTAAYREYEEKTADYSVQKWDDVTDGMDDIMKDFALCMQNGKSPDSAEAQGLVKMLQDYITGNFYLCTNEILICLGQMYVADERFRSNIDKHAYGTAGFISKAINVYCK